jgi:spore germination protein (amino acid permease)
MLLSAIIPIITLILIDLYNKRMPGVESLTQQVRLLFGKFLGSFMVLLLVIYVIGFESIIIRLFSEVTKLYLLPKTPLVVIVFIYVFTIVYVGSKGLRVIARMNEILFYLLLISFLILLIPIGEGDITNILPVGEAGWDRIIKGTYQAGQYFAGIGILMILHPLVNEKEKILKSGFIAILISTTLYVVTVIVCELVFGVKAMQNQTFPGLVLLKIVQIPVVERLEFIFLFLWLGMGARPSINMGFVASLMLTQLFNLDEKKYLPYILVLIGLAIFIVAVLPPNLLAVFKLSKYGLVGFYTFAIAYPLILFIMALIRGKKVVKNA